jgi:hypothetical protein
MIFSPKSNVFQVLYDFDVQKTVGETYQTATKAEHSGGSEKGRKLTIITKLNFHKI